MVSDEELVERLREILRTSDLDTATAGSVRKQLEDVFGQSLTDRKVFIREQIDLFLQTLQREESAKDADDLKEEVNALNSCIEKVADVESVHGKEGDTVHEENVTDRKGKKVKKARGGFSKVCSLSPQLQAVVGDPELARTEVVKRLWAYIHENSLQDPKNGKNIICDNKLQELFRVNSINMFQMNKVLSKHIWPLASDNVDKTVGSKDDVAKSNSEENMDVEEKEDEEDSVEEQETERKILRKKRGHKQTNKDNKRPRGFAKVCKLSPRLQELVGAKEMARTQVVKKLWSYIHLNNLQDPSNRRTIICDDSLRSLFDVDSIDMFQMNKALSQHISPLNEENAHEISTELETPEVEQVVEDRKESTPL